MKFNQSIHFHLPLSLQLLLLSITVSSFLIQAQFCNITEDLNTMATLGGIRDSAAGSENSVEIDSLARFAVDEHNKKENRLLEFVRVVKAQEQVVAGTLHHLTIEAIESGEQKLYEAKVWVKPWLNHKELQEFKHAAPSKTFTSSDLGAKKGDHSGGWKDVPVHDPVVRDAADHAVKTIQQRSNSLYPYQLQQIVNAKAEVVEDTAKFEMVLKLDRSGKAERFKVIVHKNDEGSFKLNHMEPHTDESA
jgi:hypothetical protein